MTMMAFHNDIFGAPSALGALRTAQDVCGGSVGAAKVLLCQSKAISNCPWGPGLYRILKELLIPFSH